LHIPKHYRDIEYFDYYFFNRWISVSIFLNYVATSRN